MSERFYKPHSNNYRGRGRGSGRAPGRGGPPTTPGRKNGTLSVRCTGYPTDINYRDFTGFLNKQVSNKTGGRIARWNNIDFNKPQRGVTIITMSTQEGVNQMLTIDGRSLKGKILRISRCTGSAYYSSLTDSETQLLLGLLGQRYDVAAKSLDLSAIISPDKKWINFHNLGFMNAVGQLIAKNCPDILSITFANNNIENLSAFSNLHQFAPKLQNLSLDANKISNIRELDYLKHFYSGLQQLILSNNPISTGCDQRIYHHEVKSRFFHLAKLDQSASPPIIKFGVSENVGKHIELNFQQESQINPSIAKIVSEFMPKFFSFMDNRVSRASLTNCYAQSARFSVTLQRGDDPEAETKHAIKTYDFVARNLLVDSESEVEQRQRTMKFGSSDIVGILKRFPVMKHEFESMQVDATIVPTAAAQLMSVVVQGSFIEVDGSASQARRPFHRSMLLAQRAGQILVVNDQLHLGYARRLETSSPTSGVNSIKLPNQGGLQVKTQEQMLVEKLSVEAKVTPEIALSALQNCQGDYLKAGQMIMQHR
eukprot:300332_1